MAPAFGIVDRMADTSPSEKPEEKPKPPTRLVLVRHAVTAHTGPLLSGRMPGVDLSDKGVGQADATAQRLSKLPVAAVYASPIERTTQTAKQIAAHHGMEVIALPGVSGNSSCLTESRIS
jgi:probable phosphoglycerate mutase